MRYIFIAEFSLPLFCKLCAEIFESSLFQRVFYIISGKFLDPGTVTEFIWSEDSRALLEDENIYYDWHSLSICPEDFVCRQFYYDSTRIGRCGERAFGRAIKESSESVAACWVNSLCLSVIWTDCRRERTERTVAGKNANSPLHTKSRFWMESKLLRNSYNICARGNILGANVTLVNLIVSLEMKYRLRDSSLECTENFWRL